MIFWICSTIVKVNEIADLQQTENNTIGQSGF